jgi:hypothetical protein
MEKTGERYFAIPHPLNIVSRASQNGSMVLIGMFKAVATFRNVLRVHQRLLIISGRVRREGLRGSQLLLGDGRQFPNRGGFDAPSLNQEGVLLPVHACEFEGPVVAMPGQHLHVVHEADILLGQEWHEALRPPFTAFLPVIEGFRAGIGGDGA